MSIFCVREGCVKGATHVPKHVVPYAAPNASAKSPAQMLINLPLCEGHVHEFGRGWKWDEQPKVKAAIQKTAGPALNFKAATVEPEPIGSALHRQQMELNEQARRRQSA